MNSKYLNSMIATAVLLGFVAASAAAQTDDPEGFLTTAAEATFSDNVKGFFSPQGEAVTAATYPTAESSRQFLDKQGIVGVNKWLHMRELTPTDKQSVVRMNRDTYYSFVIVDVSKGAKVILPEVPEGKYRSAQIVTEDHRTYPMFYGAGEFELTTHTGTHVFVIVRLDATLPQKEANKIQDKLRVEAKSSELFKAKPVTEASFTKVENELKAKFPVIFERDGVDALTGCFTSPIDDSNKLFTQEKYTVGAAIGWGGAQVVDNIYEVSGNYPADVPHEVTFEDPKNEAFWSITVYNKKGFMFNDVANVSSSTAVPNADGTYTVSFGGGPDAPNNLDIANDTGVFNIAVRHYRPSQKVIDGYRIVPAVKAVESGRISEVK